MARADDWSITTADFQTQPVVLHLFSSDGITVSSIDGKANRAVSFDNFISVQRPPVDAPRTPKFTLLLAGGDRLVGEPGPVSGEQLTWINLSLGRVQVPFSRLVAIGKGLEISPPDEPPKQDIVTLANGDTVAGIFTGSGDGNITMHTDSGDTSVPLTNITKMVFASAGPSSASQTARAFRVRLADSSMITAASVTLDGDQLKLVMPGKGATPLNAPMETVLAIEQVNGPVSWLSSYAPVENVQTPYLPGAMGWPARFDMAADGSPLSFEGHVYDHGIGVHAYSRLTFAIDPQWAAFRTQYAINSHRDDPRKFADVIVRLKLDGKVVHEQTHVHEGVLSPVVLLELKGAKTITLECDYGDAGDTQGHLNWLQPALLRDMPAPATMPSTMP